VFCAGRLVVLAAILVTLVNGRTFPSGRFVCGIPGLRGSTGTSGRSQVGAGFYGTCPATTHQIDVLIMWRGDPAPANTGFMFGRTAVLTAAALAALSTLAWPSDASSSDRGVAITIPWAVGGPRIEADGSRRIHPGEWPTFPVHRVRLWDTRTAWLNLEPRPGQFVFDHLDAHINKAREQGARDIILVLAGTPRWAASGLRATDAPWLGPGSASPPRNIADWRRFVARVAERYRGRISHYEIWNEPNFVPFFSGTPHQWADLVITASEEIRVADPEAQILTSGFALGSSNQVWRLDPWLRALPAAAQRAALSEPKSADTAGSPYIDVMSFHWYPAVGSTQNELPDAARSLRLALSRAGWPTTKLEITETNLRGGAKLSAAHQRAWMRQLDKDAAAVGLPTPFWYAWTDLGPPDLIPLHAGTPGDRQLSAFSRDAS